MMPPKEDAEHPEIFHKKPATSLAGLIIETCVCRPAGQASVGIKAESGQGRKGGLDTNPSIHRPHQQQPKNASRTGGQDGHAERDPSSRYRSTFRAHGNKFISDSRVGSTVGTASVHGPDPSYWQCIVNSLSVKSTRGQDDRSIKGFPGQRRAGCRSSDIQIKRGYESFRVRR